MSRLDAQNAVTTKMLGPQCFENRMDKGIKTTNTILYCRKWEETVEFYRDHLRLPVSFSTDWFVEFCLNPSSRLSVADENRASIKSCSGKGITLALEVGDIDKAWENIDKVGLDPTEIRRHAWNAKVFYLFDPEGHRIEIWESISAVL